MASNNRRRQKAAAKEAVEEVSFFEKHLRLIAYIAAAVVLVVLAIVLARIFINRRGAKAELALYPCEQYFLQGNYERALGGDGQQCDGFLTVASQYSMTKAGNLAKLYAGLSYAKMGQYDEARQYLEKFSPRKDEMISPAALGALGNTYVQLGEQEKGAETLVKAAKKADNPVLSPLFLVEAGEVYEALGDKDKALELYELVRSNYRGSAEGSVIDKYIERARRSK